MSAQDIQLRQLILTEFRAGNSTTQAGQNIRNQLGRGSVTASKIKYWYKRFESGDTSVFNKRSSLHSSQLELSDVQLEPGLMMSFKDQRMNHLSVFDDGRNVLCLTSHGIGSSTKFIFADLFHGKMKMMPIEMNFNSVEHYSFDRQLVMLGDEVLFAMCADSSSYVALKVNYEGWKVQCLETFPRTDALSYGTIVVDQVNKKRFIICMDNHFVLGTVENGRIVVGESKQLGMQDLYCSKLLENLLCGLRCTYIHETNNCSYLFVEFDLTTLQERSIDVQMAFENGDVFQNFLVGMHSSDYYSWSGCRLFVLSSPADQVSTLLVFNSEACSWTRTTITIKGEFAGMSIDENEILTIRSVDKKPTIVKFYRFAMKKPDSLKNLAWLKIIRGAKFSGSEIYARIVGRLPYNTDLRCHLLGQ